MFDEKEGFADPPLSVKNVIVNSRNSPDGDGAFEPLNVIVPFVLLTVAVIFGYALPLTDVAVALRSVAGKLSVPDVVEVTNPI
ncbi:hypothetical protein A2707_05230 [Candidatus Saccharibacteria bacterium RIFCSPHIGHO2_01_FULL_45_15]|nr:MAG: hypothetical protein A2707_05230 [Candidatus Saccharibacteria bacterium RIFCSPHIGHO2_01_FULL_45_15]OGL27417.1 MAG: hypothetical protein A3C39_05260 [Candidatus Saccharibacteria bacterium RIFCSPHIGHO2_02_FULL_46_12]OGL32633.1 MAG: hypothetical protein A3E76_04735 [Candidatus Saccharibacteria bacterium RIFCSPHIGHO2_12_FULL_44_22]